MRKLSFPKILLAVVAIELLGLSGCRYFQSQPSPDDKFPSSQIAQSIILAGDGGKLQQPAIDLLKDQAKILSDRLTVFFLGDNIYPASLPDQGHADYAQAYQRLMAQVNAVKDSGARVIFIPGNHDWGDPGLTGEEGWRRLKNEQAAIEGALGAGSFLPRDGCPGPLLIDLPPAFSAIVHDSSWWIRTEPKPLTPTPDCPLMSEDGIVAKISELVRSTPKGRKVVFLQHHPLQSFGKNYQGNNPQGLNGPRYLNMRRKVSAALVTTPPFICASGHDHSEQIITGSPFCRYILVSGSLSNGGSVDFDPSLAYRSSRPGFMRIDHFKDGRTRILVLGIPSATSSKTVFFETWASPSGDEGTR